MGIRKVYPTWNRTNVYEVSGRQSIRRENTCVIKITPRHNPFTDEYSFSSASGSGNGRIIQWEDLEGFVEGKILRIFCKKIDSIFILTDWQTHTNNNLNTKYLLLRTGETMCSFVTPGLLKALLRMYTTDAERITEKSQSIEQLKCEQKHSKSRNREKEGYIAWRSRVF